MSTLGESWRNKKLRNTLIEYTGWGFGMDENLPEDRAEWLKLRNALELSNLNFTLQDMRRQSILSRGMRQWMETQK